MLAGVDFLSYICIMKQELDRQDIESFEFVFAGTTIDNWFKLNRVCQMPLSNHYNRSFTLQHDFRDHQGIIIRGYEWENQQGDNDTLFRGSCKNKEELEKVLNQVGLINSLT